MLATLAQFKVRNDIAAADTDHDDVANQVLLGVSAQLAHAAGRVCAGRAALEKPAADVTWYATIDETHCRTIYVPHWPIVSITSVTEAIYGGHATADALVLNEAYQRDLGSGALRRVGYWLYGWQTVQVIYQGGYTPPSHAAAWVSGEDYTTGNRCSYAGAVYDCIDDVTGGTTAPPDDTDHWTVAAGEVALPDDLVEACLQQASFTWQRRASVGLTGMSAGAGGSLSTYARDTLLPGVADIVRSYRRVMG